MANATVNRLTHGMTLDDTDALHSASVKLLTLLNHTHGESGNSFRSMNSEAQEIYLWTCAEIASEIAYLALRLESLDGDD